MQLLPFAWRKSADSSAPKAPQAEATSPATAELRDWRLGFVSQEDEYVAPTPLTPLDGALPSDLRGSLYRNGPGRFDVYGERLSHWFDGDGKISKIGIANGVATYQSRFVATARKQHEDAAQKRLYPGFALTPRGGVWGKLKGYGDMNNANTNVIVQGGKAFGPARGRASAPSGCHHLGNIRHRHHARAASWHELHRAPQAARR